jgi:hypothetical protein
MLSSGLCPLRAFLFPHPATVPLVPTWDLGLFGFSTDCETSALSRRACFSALSALVPRPSSPHLVLALEGPSRNRTACLHRDCARPER